MRVQGLLFVAIAAIAWAGEEPSQLVSASIAFGEDKFGIDFRIQGPARSVGAGICVAAPDFAAECPYAELESEPCAAYIGIGRFQDGRALRSLPAAQAKSSGAALWSRAAGSGEALSVFGIASSGTRFVAIADPSGESGQGISDRFRFCGIEGGTGLNDRCSIDAGICIAAKPGEDSGEGWRRGAAWQPATSVLSAAVAARFAAPCAGRPIEADAWLSCDAGSLSEPGAASALRLSASWPSGFLSGASLGVFAASKRFLTVLAEPPSRDFYADLRATFRIGSWRFSAGAIAASLKADGSDGLVKVEGVSALDRILWLWRVDMATLSIEAGCETISFRAKGSADSGGLKDGALALRLAVPESGGARDGRDSSGGSGARKFAAALSGSLTARFARVSDAASSEEDDDDGGWDEEDDEYAAVESARSDLALRSLRGELDLGWDPPMGRIAGKGGAVLALAAHREGESWTLALSGTLSQSFAIGRGIALKLGVRTPSGGYSLDAAPDRMPRLSLDFVLARR